MGIAEGEICADLWSSSNRHAKAESLISMAIEIIKNCGRMAWERSTKQTPVVGSTNDH